MNLIGLTYLYKIRILQPWKTAEASNCIERGNLRRAAETRENFCDELQIIRRISIF